MRNVQSQSCDLADNYMALRQGCLTIGVAVVAFSANATNAQESKETAQALILCYNAGAIKYAINTCELPDSLMKAIYGRCDNLERKLRRAIESERGANPQVSAAVLDDIRRRIANKLHTLVLDTRISSGKNCL
jgi:hypothetical protein